MNVRALADKTFLRKFLIISLVCIGFSFWALYDGAIAFPKKKLEPAIAYEKLVESGISDSEIAKQWLVLAEEKGWPLSKPKSVKEAHGSIQQQYLMMAVALAVGIPMLVWYIRTLSAWVETTATGLKSSWGETVEFSQVKQLDKKKWYDKGIARLDYGTTSGSTKQFVLDDFKFIRSEMAQVMEWVEKNLPREKVINDNPPASKSVQSAPANEDNLADDIEE